MRADGGDKEALRGVLRQRRRAGALTESGPVLAALLRDALRSLDVPAPMVLAAFHSLPGEPDLGPLLTDAEGRGDVVVLPRTRAGRGLDWVRWTAGGELAPDRHGLAAPVGEPVPEMPGAVDLMLVPALAVDLGGTRLGYGAGYYDRALADLPRWPTGPLRVAVVHPWEVLAEPLPRMAHDAAMDAVLTTAGWRWLQRLST